MRNLVVFFTFAVFTSYVFAYEKVVCYYNTKGLQRDGQAKFDLQYIDPALDLCTHFVYGFAKINEQTYKIEPQNPHVDLTQEHYRKVLALKTRRPNLKVLLSVGGNEDLAPTNDKLNERKIKYRTLLESTEHRRNFVQSAVQLVQQNRFDGLDLAWEFPETKPKKIRGSWSNWWHKAKDSVFGESIVDDKVSDHKEQFTALVREIHREFRHTGHLLTLTVLPNVNSTQYYDSGALSPNLDLINLLAFDFYTPERNPKEADYSAPLYDIIDRKIDENVDYQVRHWLHTGAPNNKLTIGVATYGRAWKLTSESGETGVPPLRIEGAALPGPYTNEPGLLSYPEICTKLQNPYRLETQNGRHLRRVTDTSYKKKGTYAFRLPDSNGQNGTWVSYEDSDTVRDKASYARNKGLGGVAVFDITLDDFRGLCTGDRFPLLRAARNPF